MPRTLPLVTCVVLGALATFSAGCRKKVTQVQCDEVMDRFADLLANERYRDAGAAAVAQARAKEKTEAKNANEFKNCTTEVLMSEYACAMNAVTSDALIKCLE